MLPEFTGTLCEPSWLADVKCSSHSLILIIISYHWWEIRGKSAIFSFRRLHFFSLLLLLLLLLQASFDKWVIATDPLLDSTSQLPLPQLAYPIRWQHFCRQERLTFQTLVYFPLTVSAVPPTSGQSPFDSDGFIWHEETFSTVTSS